MAHTFLRAPYHILTTTKGRNICGKAPLLPGQNRLWLPPPCPPETDECPNHPDLYLLRDAAADERGAIADYLACAAETCLDEIFLDVAEDEMEHYAETMRLISWLDPVQAEMLAEEALDVLVMKRPIGKPKWATAKKAPEAADVAVPPGKKICPPFNASPRPYKMNCMP